MPVMNGIEAARQIALIFPKTAIVMITMYKPTNC
jgi:DNA-binding NarL/FixJ family response regulator